MFSHSSGSVIVFHFSEGMKAKFLKIKASLEKLLCGITPLYFITNVDTCGYLYVL